MPTRSTLPRRLLAWYDRHGRSLPWRVPPGQTPDPYRVWLAEIMLQQTRTTTVAPYYQAFLRRFPTLDALARAREEHVLAAWAGLGYYARARKLHQCARCVMQHHGGVFPSDTESLLSLPGIGPYTAAAVAAIAFGRRASAVDGNVLRVMARLHGVHTPLPTAKDELSALAAALVPARRPGDYAQALMDLGATICTPRQPACPACPWRRSCQAHARGEAAILPRRLPKPERPLRTGAAFWLQHKRRVLLRRRPSGGLLGGMLEVPSTQWRPGEQAREEDWLAEAPLLVSWSRLPGYVFHGFTHFQLRLVVYAARLAGDAVPPPPLPEQRWMQPSRAPLPSLMRKIAGHVKRHWQD